MNAITPVQDSFAGLVSYDGFAAGRAYVGVLRSAVRLSELGRETPFRNLDDTLQLCNDALDLANQIKPHSPALATDMADSVRDVLQLLRRQAAATPSTDDGISIPRRIPLPA
jgi:hypothetical protein